MAAKPAYRDRPEVEVEILDALVDRREEGMTVFELRAAVDADIDRIEAALGELKDDGLITVEQAETRLRVYPHDRVVPDATPELDDPGVLQRIRSKLGL
ncbi:hypothetical protein SAMN05192561_11047 [Halopenitus malekzadehii]|uniref:MarR family transcriptional regulator n=1 Tax=Halopenitus malekzadehii TaxID=1267564 RepID=A0A1H6JG10_9EURY|nr:DUF6432 family protein [Halopenitus malekzadehii]SEH59338.1 hypothetical protein SAMN05192561_11047 [Halopenitus malekzadehii]